VDPEEVPLAQCKSLSLYRPTISRIPSEVIDTVVGEFACSQPTPPDRRYFKFGFFSGKNCQIGTKCIGGHGKNFAISSCALTTNPEIALNSGADQMIERARRHITNRWQIEPVNLIDPSSV
jgi:hypothetical protein